MRNPANVKGTDLSSSYFPVGAGYNGGNIEVSTSLYCNIQNRASIKKQYRGILNKLANLKNSVKAGKYT